MLPTSADEAGTLKEAMMKKLFILRSDATDAPVKGEDGEIMYFDRKMVAKAQRMESQYVSPGPDHWKWRE